MTSIEKAWEKYSRKLDDRLDPAATAAIKATFMEGYYEGAKEAAAAADLIAENSLKSMHSAARADLYYRIEREKRLAKGGDRDES